MSLADLERLPKAFAWFGYNRSRFISIWDSDYLDTTPETIAEKLACRLSISVDQLPLDRIWLITVPRLLSTSFNPISLYVLLDTDGRIDLVATEVRNTYGEAHLYVLRHEHPATKRDRNGIHFLFKKVFFVSPFNGAKGDYTLTIKEPFDKEELFLRIELIDHNHTVIKTVLKLKGHTFSTRNVVSTVLRLPLSAAITMPRIAYQALLLRWVKKLPTRMKPNPTNEMTLRRESKPRWRQGRVEKRP